MNKFTITDFSGGILESNNPADFKGTTWSKLKGFVPRNDYTMESQWPIQSIGAQGSAWTGNSEEIKSVYPLQSVLGIFLVALKEDGTVWWTKAPGTNDDYTIANDCVWHQITECENYGFDANDNITQPGKIPVTANPDLRFITSLPFEVYKYIKKPDINLIDLYSIASIKKGDVTIPPTTNGIVTVTLRLNAVDNNFKKQNDIQPGDEIYIETLDANFDGVATVLSVEDSSFTYSKPGANVALISYTEGDGAYLVDGNNRANNFYYDTLVNEEIYAKSLVSGVLISSRRRYDENTNTFNYTSPVTIDTHQSLVAYVDPSSENPSVKVVSFPNIRRWPTFKVNSEKLVQYEIKQLTTTGPKYLKFTTEDNHEFKSGSKVKITGLTNDINGVYKVSNGLEDTTSGLASATSFSIKLPSNTKLKNVGLKVINGKAEPLNIKYNSIKPLVSLSKLSPGTEQSFLSRFPIQQSATQLTVTHKKSDGENLILTLSSTPNFTIGDTIKVDSVDSDFNGTYVVTDVDLVAKTITYRKDYVEYYLSVDTSSTGTVTKIETTGYPNSQNFGHPYTWFNGDMLLYPGTGFIPRGNVGTMWGNHLIIGDIEYRTDAAMTATSATKIKASANQAILGSPANDNLLRDENTAANRGAFYYSDNQIDEFNPISVLQASGTDTRIVGMHELGGKLVVITTSGSSNDGVIVYSGLLSLLHPYNPSTPANPLGVRRQLVKGGVGPADYPDYEHYDVTPTCLWPDANQVVFIDKRGGIYATDGSTVQRLDNIGPRIPRGSAPQNWVAATGKNLLVWNQANYATETGAYSARLLCLTITSSTSGTASAGWTELVGPAEFDENNNYYIYNLKSVYGCGSDFYGVVTYYQNLDGNQGNIVKSRVIRFATSGPEEEKGCSDGNRLLLTVATPPIGDPDSFTKPKWDKVGLSFYTHTSASFVGAIVKGACALEEQITVTNEAGINVKNFPMYTDIRKDGSGNLTPRSFVKGLHNIVIPAGIGNSSVASAEFILMGDVRLESASIFYTGTIPNYGEDVASEQ